MDLFNDYSNKTISFLLNYMNLTLKSADQKCDEQEFQNRLLGDHTEEDNRLLTSLFNVDALLNRSTDSERNLYLLNIDEDDSVTPVMDWGEDIPLPTTAAERSWLEFALLDPKADLFIDADIKKKALELLQAENGAFKREYVHSTINPTADTRKYSALYIKNFRILVEATKEHSPVCLQTSGTTQIVLPYRIVYDGPTDSFSLMGCNLSSDDLFFCATDLFCDDENSISIMSNDEASAPKDKDAYFDKILKKHLVPAPVVVEILRDRLASSGKYEKCNADERFSYLFSNFQTKNYINESGNMISEISYYDFQEDDVLQKILYIGRYAKILEPTNIRNKMINILKQRMNSYE